MLPLRYFPRARLREDDERPRWPGPAGMSPPPVLPPLKEGSGGTLAGADEDHVLRPIPEGRGHAGGGQKPAAAGPWLGDGAAAPRITELSRDLCGSCTSRLTRCRRRRISSTAVCWAGFAEIFQPYLPQAHENDFFFFELEIASASVTGGVYGAPKCDMYFTMRNESCGGFCPAVTGGRLCGPGGGIQRPVIEETVQADLRSAAEKIIASTVRQAELGFEGELARNTAREAQ